jgi:hypothetical protein
MSYTLKVKSCISPEVPELNMAYSVSIGRNWPSQRPKCMLGNHLKLRTHTHINTNRSSVRGSGSSNARNNGGGGDVVVVVLQ